MLDGQSTATVAMRVALETGDEHVQLQQLIGSGTYANVRQAYIRRHDTHVAMKIIDRRKARQDFVDKFLPRELLILARLRHPNIIRLVRVLDTGPYVCIVTDLCEHGDLLARVRNRRSLPEDQAKKMWAVDLSHSLCLQLPSTDRGAQLHPLDKHRAPRPQVREHLLRQVRQPEAGRLRLRPRDGQPVQHVLRQPRLRRAGDLAGGTPSTLPNFVADEAVRRLSGGRLVGRHRPVRHGHGRDAVQR